MATTILIVDDDRNCRVPFATLLRCEGYEVVEAGSGLEALQKCREKRPDLMVLDMLMPDMDGVMVLQAIRHQERGGRKRLPVLMVTHEHHPRMLQKAESLGVSAYLFKGDCPFARILELIKRNLGEFFVPRRRGRKPKVRPLPPPTVLKPTAAPRRYTEFQLRFLRETLGEVR